MPAVMHQAGSAVPQPLNSSRHLVIEKISQDNRVQHQPST